MDVQTPKVLLAVCLMGISTLTPELFSLAYNLPNMNIVADRQCQFEKGHKRYYIMLPSGEFVPNSGNVAIEKLPVFNRVECRHTKYDIKGDKQLIFNGAIYAYLRRILFRSVNGAALFCFVSRESERFEPFVQQLHDTQLKFPEVAVVLFIEGLQRAELPDLLRRHPQLFNVNLAEDKNQLCRNMTADSPTGVRVVGWSGRDKEFRMDETAKLDQAVAGLGFKAVGVKADDKLVLKPRDKDSPLPAVTFTYVQRVYQRRGTSPNPAVNQRVCLCLIPDDGRYYNERMVYYAYSMQVRFPEIYFVICFPGRSREQVLELRERFVHLDRMNIVEAPQAAALLHECDQNDVDNEGLPAEALGRKVYTFRLYGGALAEDTAVSGTPQDEIFAEFVIDKFSTREHLRYLAPALEVFPDRLVYKGYSLPYASRSAVSRYAPGKAVVFVKVTGGERLDLVCKQFVELMRQKPDVYFVFSVHRLTKDGLKVLQQQKPQVKLLNIVCGPELDELYPLSVEVGGRTLQPDFNLVMQLPTYDFYDNLYAQLYGADQLPISQRAQILADYVDRLQAELAGARGFAQNAANLDVEPPGRPAEAEAEASVERRYEYYDKLVVSKHKVLFRYYELKYLQQAEDPDDFLTKKRFCVVTLSAHSQYDANFFEKNVREVYLEAQAHPDVGYMVVVENLYDMASLFKLSKQAFYLSKLVVLEYKFGLNQVLRAPGEFVCDRMVMREMMFNRKNKFYYEVEQQADGDRNSSQLNLSLRLVCKALPHSDNIQYAVQPSNDDGVIMLDTPNSNYVVIYGILYRVIRRPETVQAQNSNQMQRRLFIFIEHENPSILDLVYDQVKRLRCSVFVVAAGIRAENVNGFVKRHPLLKLATMLSDENDTIPSIVQYVHRIHGVKNQILLLKEAEEEDGSTRVQWSDKFDDLDYSFKFQNEKYEDDDWWYQGNE